MGNIKQNIVNLQIKQVTITTQRYLTCEHARSHFMRMQTPALKHFIVKTEQNEHMKCASYTYYIIFSQYKKHQIDTCCIIFSQYKKNQILCEIWNTTYKIK
jgi:F0F1-type ATP synthase gamma subunit